MGWIKNLKKLQSGEWKIDRFRQWDNKISLPEVEIKADNVNDSSNWKKYAIGAGIVAAIIYLGYKW